MRVFISADIEGVAGVVHGARETGSEGLDYGQARRLMTREVNAAIEGALDGGATAVTVADAHGPHLNLLPEELHPAARLIRGKPRPLGMVHGVDGGFDLAFFTGYHVRSGEVGVLNHTYTGYYLDVRVNGRSFGETGLNAALAGHFGVPLALVTGDGGVCAEAAALVEGGLETVAVKEAIGRYAADSLHPEAARDAIRVAARRALERRAEWRPFVVAGPVRLEAAFATTAHADLAALIPTVERVDGRTVAYDAPDYLAAYRMLRAITVISGAPV